MKSMARRAFLRMLPAAGLAGRAVAEQTAAKLAGVNISGIHNQGPPMAETSSQTVDRAKMLSTMLRTPLLRAELMSLLYEENRLVWAIDHDLASKRSFSLAAKITFQRQRNVESSLNCDLLDQSAYQRKNRLIQRWLSAWWGRL